ncbi:hypothetical protein [Microbacterium sp. 11MF]|uniref:hypothetical protein n=1 Tax=Microbacterium sp. 11MF TaxID=1169146 RepID=UPI000688D714|nr:hypothetical protein [Microbacterium sp. 11MF]
MSYRPVRRWARVHAVVAMLAGAVVLGALTAAPSSAVSENPRLFCDLPGQKLAISPMNLLKAGQRIWWKTSLTGEYASTLSGEYVGKLYNALGADTAGQPRDLLLVRLDGINGEPGELDTGVWAGMSGSPVYDDRQRLIGAISYGFSSLPNNVVGVTPAAYIKSLGVLPASKTLGRSQTESVEDMVNEPSTARSATLKRIDPVRVTIGSSASDIDETTTRLGDRIDGFRGVAATGRAVPGGEYRARDYPILAGGNIAVSYGYGAVTEASVGTVTAVCGTEVFAFGHPSSGNSKLSANIHGALTARIVPDPEGSYKLISAIGKPKGKLVEDRTVGVRAKLGIIRPTIEVRTTSAYGDVKNAMTTNVSEQQFVASAAYTQLGNEVVRMLDNAQEGSARVEWRITYQRADGSTAILKNANRYSSKTDLPYVVGEGVANDVAALQSNSFEEVRIQSVHVLTRFESDHRIAKVGGVQMLKGGKWVTVDSGSVTKVARGGSYSFRAVLSPAPGAEKVTEYAPFTLTVPRDVRSTYQVELFAPDADDEFGGEGPAPRTFAQFVAGLDDNHRSDVVTREVSYTSTAGPRKASGATIVTPTVLVANGASVSVRFEVPAAR